jgi:YVTN family beta-propeller protein
MASPACKPKAVTAYVVNQFGSTVTPINTATNTALKPIAVGHAPDAIAMTPDGKTAYVANQGDGTVTPKPITVGLDPITIAFGRPSLRRHHR